MWAIVCWWGQASVFNSQWMPNPSPILIFARTYKLHATYAALETEKFYKSYMYHVSNVKLNNPFRLSSIFFFPLCFTLCRIRGQWPMWINKFFKFRSPHRSWESRGQMCKATGLLAMAHCWQCDLKLTYLWHEHFKVCQLPVRCSAWWMPPTILPSPPLWFLKINVPYLA